MRQPVPQHVGKRVVFVVALGALLAASTGCGGSAPADAAPRVEASALCTGAKLTATPNGSVVTLTGTACAAGELKFLVRPPGAASFTVVQEYGPATTATVDTTGKPAGRWDFALWTRDVGSKATYESTAGASLLVGDVCTAATLAVTPLGGGVFDLAATATCAGGAPADYKFLVKAPGGASYQEIRPYAKEPTFRWTASVPPGRSDVLVYARRAGSGSTYEAFATASALIGPVCTAAKLTATPAATGAGLDLAASATCDDGAIPEFKLLARAPGTTTYNEIRGYNTDAKFPWDTAAVEPSGRWDLLVYARAKGNLSTYEATGTAVGNVGATCTAATLASIPLDPPGYPATSFRFTASATCAEGASAEYRFLLRAPGETTYQEVRAWSADPAYFGSLGPAPGRWDVIVHTRRAGNLSAAEASASLSQNAGVTCKAVALTTSHPYDGSALELAASATCWYGITAEYRFLAKAPGAATAQELRGWSTDPHAWFDDRNAASGAWELTVQARAAGNASAYEAVATATQAVGAACAAVTLAGDPPDAGPYELAAAASCTPGATPEYRFAVRRPGATAVEELRGYALDARVPFDAGTAAPGRYEFTVYARRAGNASAWEATATLVRYVGPTCRSATLALTSPPYDTYGLDAVTTAACDPGVTPEYRFLGRAPGAAIAQELMPWTGDPSFRWNTYDLRLSGRYEVTVQVRAAGNASAYEATATAARNVGAACSLATLRVAPGPGSLVLTAGSSCLGYVPEYRFLGRAPGAATFEELRPYSWEQVIEVPATTRGRYELQVQVRVAGNASTYEAAASAVATVGPTCTQASLDLPPGSSLVIDALARATCDAGAMPEFQFLGRAPGAAAFTELRPYSLLSNFQWDIERLGTGRYELKVQARAAGNPSTWEAADTKTRDVGDACTSAALEVTPGAAGLDLVATAACGRAIPELRFLARPPGAAGFVELRGYGQAPTATYDPAPGSGRYEFRVEARATGNASTAEATATVSELVGETCAVDGLQVMDLGGPVQLQAVASCTYGGPPELRFLAKAPGASVAQELQPYSATTSAWFDPTPLGAGRWEFTAQARSYRNASDYEGAATVAHLVGPTCTAATLTGTDDGPFVSLSATSTCAAGAAEYRYLVRPPGAAAPAEVRAWSSDPNHVLDLSRVAPGRHEITVYARVAGNASTYEASATIARLVGPTCSAATLTSTPADGTRFDLGATATCSDGAVPEYRFLVRGARDASYRELRPYGADAAFRWDTAGLASGRYDLLVYARAAGNASSYEAYAVAPRNVGATCDAATLRVHWTDYGLNLDATARCAEGTVPEYQFLVKPPGATAYEELRPYDLGAFWDVYGPLAPGAYTFLVNVRAQGNASRAEASAGASYAEPDCSAGPGAPTALRFMESPRDAAAGDWLRARVHVVDASGCRVDGYGPAVTLGLRGGPAGAVLEGTTSGDAIFGDVIFDQVYTTRAGTYALVASAPGLASAVSPAFTVSATSAAVETSTLAVTPVQIVAGEPAVASITLRDYFGNPLIGAPVQLTAVRHHIDVTSPAPTTDAAGHVAVSFSSPYTGTTDVSFTAPGLWDGALARTVTFVAGAPSAATSTLVADAPAYADDKPVTLTLFVRDALGNGVPNAAVTLAATGAVMLTQPAPTNPGGYTTATARSSTVGTSTLTASVGGQVVASLALEFQVVPPLEIATAALPDAYQTESYATTLAAKFGTAPHTWSLASGALPAGLSLSASGTISGTVPAGAASTTFTVRVGDAAGAFATRQLSIGAYGSLKLQYPSPPVAYPYVPYAISPTVSGGKPPLRFEASWMPTGFSVGASSGTISGSFLNAWYIGSPQRWDARVTDANGRTATWQLDVTVAGAPSIPGGGASVARWGKITDALTVIAVDEANRPLPGLAVRVRRSGVELGEVMTGYDGHAYLSGLSGSPGDTWDVTVSGPGWANTSILGFNARVVTVPMTARPELQARSEHQAAWSASTGKVLVFGGALGNTWDYSAGKQVGGPFARARRFGTDSDPVYTSDLLAIDPATGAVTELVAPMMKGAPPPTADGAMTAIGSRIVLFGGWITTPASPTVRQLSGGTWEWNGTAWTAIGGPAPAARAGAGLAADASTAYLFGGALAGDVFTNEVWKLTGTSWTKLTTSGPLPAPRAQAAVGVDVARKKLVVLGGRNAAGNVADLWELDLVTLAWSQKAAGGSTDRDGAAMACAPAGGRCFAFGGRTTALATPTDMVAWDGTTVASLPAQTEAYPPDGRVHATFVPVGGSRYLLFGGGNTWYPYGQSFPGVWTWDASTNVWTRLRDDVDYQTPPPTAPLTISVLGEFFQHVQLDLASQGGTTIQSSTMAADGTPHTFDVPADTTVRVLATSDEWPIGAVSQEVHVPASGATLAFTLPSDAPTRTTGYAVQFPAAWTEYQDLYRRAYAFFPHEGNQVWSDYPVLAFLGGAYGASTAPDTEFVEYALDPQRFTDVVSEGVSTLPTTCERSFAALLGTNASVAGARIVHQAVGASMTGTSECGGGAPTATSALYFDAPAGTDLAVVRFAPLGQPVEWVVYQPATGGTRVRVDLLPQPSTRVASRTLRTGQYLDWTVDTIGIPQLPGANGISEAPFRFLRWESRQESGARSYERQ
jgi:hypothetical protein